MAENVDKLGNDSQLGKVLFELLGKIAISSVLKARKNEGKSFNSPTQGGAGFEGSKSVPVSPIERIATSRLAKSDDESEKLEPSAGNKTVDPKLGRPRYHWQVPGKCSTYEKDRRKRVADLKELFSVYVGHLPCDMTEDELVDLFKDIGEVIDVFVFPTQSSHNYTYGFVRFLTLDEAQDAVREKHLKMIGNKQIQVELSSETRQKLQDNDIDEESHQLLKKDYPKVIRRPVGESDDKKVIAKIKTGLCRLKGTHSLAFGECSSEELLENVRTILRMIINFPMNLADPSADEGKGPLKYAKTNSASRCQAPANGNDTNSSDGIKNIILLSSSERGRLPSLPFDDPDTMDKNNDEHTGNAFESVSSLPVRRVAEKECSFSERSNSALIQKVQHILYLSQSKEVAQPNDLFFTRNSGSCSSSILNSQSAREVPIHSKSLTKVKNKLDSSVAQRRQTAQNDSYFDSPAPESANCSRGRTFVEAAEGADEQVKSCNVQLEPLRSPALDAMPYAQWREDASPCKQPDVDDCNPSTSSRSIMKTNCMNTSSMHGSNAGPNAQDDESYVSPDSSSSLSYITLTEAKNASGCLSSGHEDAEKLGTESSIVKSPCRRYRSLTLAPSFSKPLVNRNEVSQQSVRLTDKLSGASNLNKSCNGFPSITLLDSKKVKAAQVISDDEAVVNISKGTHDSQPLELGISHGSCLVPEPHFESPVPKNDVVEFNNDESHVETIKLKENLKQQHLRLEVLHQNLCKPPHWKREKSRKQFDDSACLELEVQIHDAEVLLQKKNEIWASRLCEQELVYEREKLRSVDNTVLLNQLTIEMEKEYLKNEISVTELKCRILELKMKCLHEESNRKI